MTDGVSTFFNMHFLLACFFVCLFVYMVMVTKCPFLVCMCACAPLSGCMVYVLLYSILFTLHGVLGFTFRSRSVAW